MDISEQVISVEQAQRLWELGVRNKSLFCHTYDKTQKEYCMNWGCALQPYDFEKWNSDYFTHYPAYTVSELGVMLPWEIGDDWSICLEKSADDSNYIISYDNYDGVMGNKLFIKPTEAQARAECLIWLLENKHINPSDIKL